MLSDIGMIYEEMYAYLLIVKILVFNQYLWFDSDFIRVCYRLMHDSRWAEFSDVKARAYEIKFSFWLDACLVNNDERIVDGLGSRVS